MRAAGRDQPASEPAGGRSLLRQAVLRSRRRSTRQPPRWVIRESVAELRKVDWPNRPRRSGNRGRHHCRAHRRRLSLGVDQLIRPFVRTSVCSEVCMFLGM